MQAYLMDAALDGAQLTGGAEAQPIAGAALGKLCNDYLVVENTIKRLARRYDSQLLKVLTYQSILSPDALQQTQTALAFVDELKSKLASEQNGVRYDVEAGTASNGQTEILVTRSEHGLTSISRIDGEFLSSGEYRSMCRLGSQLQGLMHSGASVQRNEKSQLVANFEEAFNWLMDEARRGQSIQRYKGLGEMNPEQLWETTMEPSTRRLLKVNIEDGVAADEVFTTLMGDQVEPRREFIEKNALAATNLDI
jgi:DNA gyrase subunit B